MFIIITFPIYFIHTVFRDKYQKQFIYSNQNTYDKQNVFLAPQSKLKNVDTMTVRGIAIIKPMLPANVFNISAAIIS